MFQRSMLCIKKYKKKIKEKGKEKERKKWRKKMRKSQKVKNKACIVVQQYAIGTTSCI